MPLGVVGCNEIQRRDDLSMQMMTTSTFGNHATAFARHLSQRVVLIDGRQFADLEIEHGVGVRVSRALHFKRLDEDFFTEDE